MGKLRHGACRNPYPEPPQPARGRIQESGAGRGRELTIPCPPHLHSFAAGRAQGGVPSTPKDTPPTRCCPSLQNGGQQKLLWGGERTEVHWGPPCHLWPGQGAVQCLKFPCLQATLFGHPLLHLWGWGDLRGGPHRWGRAAAMQSGGARQPCAAGGKRKLLVGMGGRWPPGDVGPTLGWGCSPSMVPQGKPRKARWGGGAQRCWGLHTGTGPCCRVGGVGCTEDPPAGTCWTCAASPASHMHMHTHAHANMCAFHCQSRLHL